MTEGRLVEGKRGLVLGVANDKSIAWGIARVLADHGAELAFTYQDEQFGKRVIPLAESLGSPLVLKADVQSPDSLDSVFERLAGDWGRLDFLIHAIAFSDKEEFVRPFVDTTRANFLKSMDISCYSLIDLARRAAPLMTDGGSITTLTYLGAQRVMPHYNVMGVVKAALESTVRYLANDLGPQCIRVNAISPGPMRTLAGAAIAGARRVYKTAEINAPLRANATLEAIGGTALYLASEFGACTTGEVIFVDGGYHAIGMPQPENLG